MATALVEKNSPIQQILGKDAESLLGFKNPKISKDRLHLPGPDFVDRILIPSDRNPQAIRSLQCLFDNGRLRGTGYVSILPVDQGVEHSAGKVKPVFRDLRILKAKERLRVFAEYLLNRRKTG